MNVLVLLTFFLLINISSYILFAKDKQRAKCGQWRIGETTLLAHAAFGGWLGAKIGQRLLRHKTRKQPFGRRLNCICFIHIALLTTLVATTDGQTFRRAIDSSVAALTGSGPLEPPAR